MEKIKIIVDSTCDLEKEWLDSHDVSVIPLYISFDDNTYLDGVDLNTEQLYKKVKELDKLPKTAARSSYEFEQVFQEFLNQGYDKIIFFGISSYFSSTVQNATIASQEFEGKVFVHDTLNLSTGEGLQIIRAVRMRDEGKPVEEILKEMNRIVPLVRAQFAVETLDFLYKGGRCSQASYFLGKTIKLKPIIRVVDGKMIVYKKPLGKMINGLNKLLDIIKEDADNLDLETIMVTHSMTKDNAAYLVSELEKFVPKESIMVTQAGCTISSHCGPGTIGILYILKQ